MKFIEAKKITITSNNKRTISTNGGDYNQKVERDYIEGNKNNIRDNSVNQYITLEDKQVEISSDISQTLGELKDILNEMIGKNPDPVEAISHFAKELAQELRRQPEVKVNLDGLEDSNEQELVNKIIIDLLTKNYEQISQITRTYPINQSSQIQKINTNNGLEYTDYYILNDESDRDVKEYNGYIIELAKDHENMWSFKIKRENNSYLDLINQRRSRSKDNAVGKAKTIIDRDRMANWKNDKDTFK